MDEKRIDAVETVPASMSAKGKRKRPVRVGEIKSLSTEHRKVFRMDDGSEQAVFSPVTTVNADTPWELDASGKQYRKQIGPLRAAFSCNKANHEMFSLEKDSHKVTFSAAMNPGQRRSGIVPILRQADGTDNVFLFKNMADNTDMEYTVMSGGVKENILVKQQANCYRYPFAICCENVSISSDSTAKHIKFVSNGSGEEVFFIPAPFMVDARGDVSADVHYEIETQKNGSAMLTIVASSDWINDRSRTFPVTIDPQVMVSGSTGIDTYSWIDGTMSTPTEHVIGRVAVTDPDTGAVSYSTNRMYLHFDLPTLPNNPRIKKAELVLCQNSVSNESGSIPKLGLFRVTEDIAVATMTPSLSPLFIDFEPMKSASEDGTVVTYTFDITKAFDEAANGASSYQNLVLQLMDESILSNSYVTLAGNSSAENLPSICVTYETSYSVNSSYPSHTHAIGPFGQGSVDLSRGTLMFEAEDFAWSGNRMPVTVRHLYTSALAGYPYTNNDAIDLVTADFSGMSLGSGWKLNLMQSMKPYVFMHEGVQSSGYVYMDENGDAVYLKAQSENADLYEAIDNSDMVFDSTTGILKQGDESYQFDDAGRLVSISDEFNTMTLSYTQGRLTAVTDGVGRSFTFAYDTEGHLASIAAPDSTQVVYGYDGDLLTSLTYPNGSKAAITYADNKPASVSVLGAENNVLYKVCYTFNGDKVSSVAEFGENNTEGKCSTYSYSAAAHRTVVQSTEQADEEGAQDEVITTVYTFDEDGEILSQYAYAQETNKVGINGTGSGIHPYFGENGVSTINASRNLLYNHSLEYGSVGSTDDSYFGSRVLKVTSEDAANTCTGPGQSVTLQPGDYTLSAYVRFIPNMPTADGNGAYLQVDDASGNLLGRSETLTFSEKHYVRMAVPFHLDEALSVNNRMLLHGAGTAYFDGLQLEANAFASPYNLLRNGSFEDGDNACWIRSSADDVVYTNIASFDGSTALRFSGDLDKAVKVKQDVLVRTARSDRETFTLSGWALAAAVPQRDRDMDTEPHFRLRAEIHYNDTAYEDTSVETFTADFCACTEDWQYASVEFSKSKYRTVEKVLVFCDYDHNNGYAFFDDIQLIRNSLETGLDAEDFPTESNDDEVDVASEDTAEEYTAPEHMERKDRFGNAITETTFTDGEFGTIYRAFDYGVRDDDTTTTGNDLLRETDARGYTTEYEVDEATSRNETVTDRCGNKTAYEYDASGKTTKVTAKTADGTDIASVDYSYDAYGELTAITRGDGMAYDLSYDAFHNLESIGVRGKAEKLVNYTYKNGNGRLKEITYANGDTMKATYNALGQLVAEKWFDATGSLTAHYRYTYDNEGNIVRSVDISSLKEYNYLYEESRISRASECDITVDENGMVLTRTVLFTLRYIYDEEGTLIRKHVIPADNTCHEIFFYEEDSNDSTVLKAKLNEKTYTSHSKTDSFGRKEFDEIQTGFASIFRQFQYHAGEVPAEYTDPIYGDKGAVKSAPTTNLVKQILLSDGRTISYEYDPEERITKVIDSVDGTTEYTYDAQGQLLTETTNGVVLNTMTYDAYGNILTKNGKVYTYGDTAWKDKLTAYNGENITYDAQGNPLNYLGSTLTWEKGRQLKSLVNSEVSCAYTYNANGIRTSKTVNGVKHTYTLDGTKVLRETWPGIDENGATYTNYLIPLYDNEENVCGILYNDIPYYFLKNLQGDVIAICNQDGQPKARYIYDAWGSCCITDNDLESDIANINPFRYRGYYYDAEIGMYYLQSRYYDPTLGRFVNGDDADYLLEYFSTNEYHMYSYCGNNSANFADETGHFRINIIIPPNPICTNKKIKAFAKKAAKIINKFVNHAKKAKTIISGISKKLKAVVKLAASKIVSHLKSVLKKVKDWLNKKIKKLKKWFNENIKITTYRGVPVVVLKALKQNAFSFGIIFIGEDAYKQWQKGKDPVLEHEYGHVIQLISVGFPVYIAMYFVPSLIGFWSGVPIDMYYSQPWEYIADLLGGAKRTGYDYKLNDGLGWIYFAVSVCLSFVLNSIL